MKRNKIGLLGPVISGNLGNAALEAAVIQELAPRFPEAHFYVSTGDSLEALKNYGVRLFPLHRGVDKNFFSKPTVALWAPTTPIKSSALRRLLKKIPLLRPSVLKLRSLRRRCTALSQEVAFWVRSYAFVREFRYLIVCGGGQLDDLWGGPWGLPYALFTWALLAKLAGCSFIFLSVGAERTDSRLGRFFLRYALGLTQYRSYRDAHSKRIAEELGSRGEQFVYPDLAFGLNLPLTTLQPALDGVTRIVGVGPIAYCDPRAWPVKDETRYNRYLQALVQFVEYLIKAQRRVVLFTSQIDMDQPVIRDVKNLIRQRGLEPADLLLLEEPITNLTHLMTFLPQLDVVVGSRLHGCLLATLVGTPVLAISHEMKVTALMSDLGMSEFCLSIDKLESKDLLERFWLLEHELPKMRARIIARVREYRESLEEQYARVFGRLSPEAMASYGDHDTKVISESY